jgi:glycosyltransferase involved in cell wall biosynthesis
MNGYRGIRKNWELSNFLFMTKVLIFSTAYFPFVGGAEVAVKEITDRISAIQFDLITARMDRKLPKKEKIGNVMVYRMGFGWGGIDKIILAKWGFLKALRLNKKNNYEVAWSIMASQASIAASFFKIFNKNIKLILTLQEGDEEEHLARYVFNIKWLYKILIRPWHLLVFKKADKVTAISNYLKERAERNGVKVPVEIVPNGVDINFFKKTDNLDKFQSKLKLSLNYIWLITTSRLVKKNGVEDIIKSLKYLEKKFKLFIIGSGPLEKRLREITKDLDLKDRVEFLGQKDYKDIPEYINVSKIFIRPSLSEGLGNSFLEAMAAGVPVIGTRVGGIPDFLHEGETGLFCEVNNPESIAKRVMEYINNPSRTDKIVENAKKMVEEKYNWGNIAKKMEEVFKK